MTKTGIPINSDDSQSTLTVSTTVEWGQESAPTPLHAVVSAVAEAEDVDPVELPPLYNAIDPDALNALVTSDSSTVSTVTFQYAGYAVVVRGEGKVEVQPATTY